MKPRATGGDTATAVPKEALVRANGRAPKRHAHTPGRANGQARPGRSGSLPATMSSHEDTPLGLLIAQAYRLELIRSSEVLRRFGLSVPQAQCMHVLYERPAMSNGEMAAELFVTPQAVSIVQRSLEDAGLVQRRRDSPDGRVRMTSLTTKGRKLFRDCDAAMRVSDDDLLQVLPAADRKRIKKLLVALIESQPG
jgi:MarR family transcriptional regulator, organic hydroperoxide resistance regulator